MVTDHHRSANRRPDGRAPLRGTGAPLEVTTPAGDGTAIESGTTVVGLTAGDAVVLAADRRASLGGRFVASKRARKVEPVHPTAAAALSGAMGGIRRFVRTLRAESRLYADRRGEPMTMAALSTLAGTVLRGAPFRVTPLLGGVDEDGPHLFQLDGGGGVLADAYAAGGSGMQVAYGVLEREYEADLSVGAARGVAARAVGSASERDTASGNGLAVATATDEGVEVEVHDTVEAVA